MKFEEGTFSSRILRRQGLGNEIASYVETEHSQQQKVFYDRVEI